MKKIFAKFLAIAFAAMPLLSATPAGAEPLEEDTYVEQEISIPDVSADDIRENTEENLLTDAPDNAIYEGEDDAVFNGSIEDEEPAFCPIVRPHCR